LQLFSPADALERRSVMYYYIHVFSNKRNENQKVDGEMSHAGGGSKENIHISLLLKTVFGSSPPEHTEQEELFKI
jgi:hypothetical protein